ncbi:ATPase, T2SS/T4P/T4SS family [Burkholderia metallica]|uniref:ATPase, T2SS/T4P/T4SS family n=1 Tax=Burkholderia metallica TaxID=488729 RepID=A0ABT8PHN0_9BURK|nr:ATPase, T2SS/T4P/T4SS family [Burkholderia metallica]MDN7934587.1 ATPase, T2SS/T4P/T4SS family [Burkholderia metallica]
MKSHSVCSNLDRTVAIDELGDAVRRGANILISGIGSSGKSSLLCVLAAQIPLFERVIVIDDSRAVVVLGGDPSSVRPVPVDGDDRVVRWALDTYPDRIIVDDIRDNEASAFVRAHSAGRSGGLASLQASSGRKALGRLEAMLATASGPNQIEELPDIQLTISTCFSYVVHVQREDAGPYVSEVLAVQGFKDGDYVLKRIF